jgi:asparagine synthase (glutamine-hydrolysing)
MCGIFVCTHGSKPEKDILGHRGPDQFVSIDCLTFWRLAINGGQGGLQPLEHNNKWIVANAEIYNYLELGGKLGRSDCEVILPTVEKYGLARACELFRGDFAFVYTDAEHFWAARDSVGVRPLFYCRHAKGVAFASEAKALLKFKTNVEVFPPGHLYDSRLDRFVCWASNYWPNPRQDTDEEFVEEHIRHLLTDSVNLRVEAGRPVGFFLSGGLDSSIVAALGAKKLGKIRTFSIGLPGSPDLVASRKMADFIGSDHTEVTFTIDEGLKAIKDVIWHLESWDTTTVRASVPMYLLSKYIKEHTDIRVILSGEGADELFGGYLYFHSAPSVDEFRTETNRLVRDVHLFDVLRADRTTSAHGIELRVPFFDRDVIDYVMDGFSTELKMPRAGYEKFILRKAFEDILPYEIAWRQKNGMSDAVGYDWASALRKYGEAKYQDIYKTFFPANLVPYKWMPKWVKADDPSGALLSVFNDNEK